MGKGVPETPPEILIVDDEPDICWALAHLLGKDGFVTRTAQSGRKALRLFLTERFPAVLLDAKLPDVDGLELAQRMREIDREVYIVLVSGFFSGDDRVVREAQARGLVQHFISKPFRHEEIAEVSHLVGQRGSGVRKGVGFPTSGGGSMERIPYPRQAKSGRARKR